MDKNDLGTPLTPEEQEIVLGGDCPKCGGTLDLDTNTCERCGTVYRIHWFLATPN